MNKGDVTLKDIAKAVGKSVAAVSKALHDHQDIAPETRETIKQTAQEMGYVPNVTAQRLQKRRTDTLGLIVPIFSARQADPFFTELLSGVADQATKEGFDLLVSARTPGPEEQTAYQRLIHQRRVDGVIVAQPRLQDWRIDFLTTQAMPFVVVGHQKAAYRGSGVWIDTRHGIQQAVEHLVEQGRKHVAFIPPPAEMMFAEVSCQAFQEVTATQANLRQQITESVSAFSQQEGYKAAQRLLMNNDPPDGIIACHDLVAMGAMAAIRDQGFEVGSDMAIIGFGDILLSEHAQPPLTSLHQPTFSMGQQACQMLIDFIAEPPIEPPQVIIDPWLVVRQSSGLEFWL